MYIFVIVLFLSYVVK